MSTIPNVMPSIVVVPAEGYPPATGSGASSGRNVRLFAAWSPCEELLPVDWLLESVESGSLLDSVILESATTELVEDSPVFDDSGMVDDDFPHPARMSDEATSKTNCFLFMF